MVLLSQVTVAEKGRGMQDSTRESLRPRCNRVITVDLLRSVGQFEIRGCRGHSWLGLVSFGLHHRKYQPESLSECIVELVDARTIRICKKDSHLLHAVSKLRRELRNKKFNRKLRASCECNGRGGCGILPIQTSMGMASRKKDIFMPCLKCDFGHLENVLNCPRDRGAFQAFKFL